MQNNRPTRPSCPGGQHAATAGDSTRIDFRDEYHFRPSGHPDRDEARALEEFNRELQRAINREFGSQPF
jgi:hypothetical protein